MYTRTHAVGPVILAIEAVVQMPKTWHAGDSPGKDQVPESKGFVYLSIYPSIYLLVCLPVYLSIYRSLYLSMYMHVCVCTYLYTT